MTEVIKDKNSFISYYVDKDKKTVVAKINVVYIIYEVNKALNDKNVNAVIVEKGRKNLNKKFPNYFLKNPFSDYIIDNYKYKNITAKAICSKDDEFDVEVGKRIARERLLEKFYKIRLDYLRCIGDELSRQIDYVEDQMNYTWVRLDKFIKTNKETLDKNKG